ncbi:hypothetical protein B0H16DRAFT_1723208 [Mycena metata]|uniref:Uncharacterized protein n=1 Tax=Mycena metata TaxID=1033252 RepID=A0AAD7IYF0_9AGAR|nr:hypothetical protein B0H16DRAFT_1723208 [Mycena metata]
MMRPSRQWPEGPGVRRIYLSKSHGSPESALCSARHLPSRAGHWLLSQRIDSRLPALTSPSRSRPRTFILRPSYRSISSLPLSSGSLRARAIHNPADSSISSRTRPSILSRSSRPPAQCFEAVNSVFSSAAFSAMRIQMHQLQYHPPSTICHPHIRPTRYTVLPHVALANMFIYHGSTTSTGRIRVRRDVPERGVGTMRCDAAASIATPLALLVLSPFHMVFPSFAPAYRFFCFAARWLPRKTLAALE